MQSRMTRLLHSVCLAPVFLTFSFAASATILDFTFDLSGPAFLPPGLIVQSDSPDGAFGLDLAPRSSASVDLFTLWTEAERIEPSHLVARSLLVDIAMPSFGATGRITGTTIGHLEFFDILHWGTVSWDAPLVLQFGNGGRLSIDLRNAIFNFGFNGLRPGRWDGATINATVTYLRAPAQVPLPASGALALGSCLFGLGTAAVRRRVGRA